LCLGEETNGCYPKKEKGRNPYPSSSLLRKKKKKKKGEGGGDGLLFSFASAQPRKRGGRTKGLREEERGGEGKRKGDERFFLYSIELEEEKEKIGKRNRLFPILLYLPAARKGEEYKSREPILEREEKRKTVSSIFL